MQFQRITFENREGIRLSARLDLPMDEKPHAFAIFAHCFTCSKNFNAVVHINRALARHGIAVLRFDFTGLGESEGDFSETNFSSNVTDLTAAADYLKQNFEAPKLLIGHSLGGAAVLQAASRIPSCRGVATIASPASLRHLAGLFDSKREELETRGETRITLGGRGFRIRKQFVDDLAGIRMEETVRSLGRPLLIMHSPADDVVGIENAREIFDAADHPKSFVSLDGADHLLSDRRESLYAGSVLAAWAQKYLGKGEDGDKNQDLRDNRVVVRTGRVGYQTEIMANGHSLIADEPIPAGGADTGPTPYDLLVAGLGACTAITLRMYADRKRWPLEAVTVRLRHQKIHAGDCSECEAGEGKIDQIDREIIPAGPLNSEQRERLLSMADRCPVHRTLRGPIKIETRLGEEEG